MEKTAAMANSAKQEQETEDMGFLEEYAGQGLESISSNECALSYLSLVQPGSSVESTDNPAGTWRNSATGKNYGNMVRVVVVAFRTVWNEREADPPFRTVGRYAPNSIQVEVRQPKPGKRGYPKMFNPETGNEVQELYVYAVVLPDFPEDGVLYFNPTVGSMRACKSWNTQLMSQTLPTGAKAPIFGFGWNLLSELVPNPVKPTENMARFTKVAKDTLVSRELFTDYIKPQLQAVNTAVLQITASVDMYDTEASVKEGEAE